MYWRGDGIALNNAEAFRLFQKSCCQGTHGRSDKTSHAGMPRDLERRRIQKQPTRGYFQPLMRRGQRGRDLIPSLAAELTNEQISFAHQRVQSPQFERSQELSDKTLAP